MDPQKTYRVTPVVDPDKPGLAPSVFAASGDFEALARARRLLGTDAAFDLYQADRLVVRHRPQRPPESRG